MSEKRLDKAIYIAKLSTELFPNDGNIWDSMGDIYFNAKQNDKVLDSLQKAMELIPEDGDCFLCEISLRHNVFRKYHLNVVFFREF